MSKPDTRGARFIANERGRESEETPVAYKESVIGDWPATVPLYEAAAAHAQELPLSWLLRFRQEMGL